MYVCCMTSMEVVVDGGAAASDAELKCLSTSKIKNLSWSKRCDVVYNDTTTVETLWSQ